MKREDLMRKLKALLARADASSNDNENEREIAMRQATSLMDKYNLSIAEVQLDAADRDDPRGKADLATGSNKWKSGIVGALAELYGCECYRTRGRYGRTYVIGRASARTTVLELSRYCIDSVDREARKHRSEGRSFTHAFRVGAMSGIWAQVRSLIAERRAEAMFDRPGQTDGTAMVLASFYDAEKQRNTELMHALGVRPTGGGGAWSSDRSGRAMGHSYGSSLNLNRQLGGTTQRRLR